MGAVEPDAAPCPNSDKPLAPTLSRKRGEEAGVRITQILRGGSTPKAAGRGRCYAGNPTPLAKASDPPLRGG